jgi:hypothetical protein
VASEAVHAHTARLSAAILILFISKPHFLLLRGV